MPTYPVGMDFSGVWYFDRLARPLRPPQCAVHGGAAIAHDGARMIAADVRLDNRAELLERLRLGREGTPLSDAALILAAYARWKVHCVERLLGDFAFVLWDGVARSLFAARDHFGVKPLYYHWDPAAGTFAAASAITPLLALPQVSHRVNEVRIAEYLVPLLEDQTATFYGDVLRLPPAHRLVVPAAGTAPQLSAYWTRDHGRDVRVTTHDDYAEQFRALLTAAVRVRLDSSGPGPIGVTLDGGFDATAVYHTAREWRSPADVVPLSIACETLAPAATLPQLLDVAEEPFLYAFEFVHDALYRAAAEASVRAVLDGLDADTTAAPGVSLLAARSMIAPDFARRVDLDARLAAHNGNGGGGGGGGGLTMLLELLAKLAAARGVEARHPFLDRRLAEFCLALPPSDAIPKRRARPELSDRFALNLLRSGGADLTIPLRDLRMARIGPYVHHGAVAGALAEYDARPSAATALPLWKAAQLEVWLDRSEAGSLTP